MGQLTEEFFGKLKDCLPAKAKIKHFWSYFGDIGYSESNLALMGQIWLLFYESTREALVLDPFPVKTANL